MPQQINLCSPILLTKKRYFSAAAMGFSLLLFILIAGILCFYLAWGIISSAQVFEQNTRQQVDEIKSLQASLNQIRQAPKTEKDSLLKEIKDFTEEASYKEALIQEMKRGFFVPGLGHSDRLHLVSKSIPDQVWITKLKGDDGLLDISGFTLEPSALNDWVKQLSRSPLLDGQRLSAVNVEKVVLNGPSLAGQPAASTPALTPFYLPGSYVVPVPGTILAPLPVRIKPQSSPMPLPGVSDDSVTGVEVPQNSTRSAWSFRLLSQKDMLLLEQGKK